MPEKMIATANDVVLRNLPVESAYDQALLPIELTEFNAGGKTYRFTSPFVLYPKWDETQEYLEVECEDYDLFLYARNRELLFKEIKDEFVMLWRVYVMGHEKLSLGAEELKKTLMKNMKVSNRVHGTEQIRH